MPNYKIVHYTFDNEINCSKKKHMLVKHYYGSHVHVCVHTWGL